MTPSAKELEAKIGDKFVVSPEGARALNEKFNLGVKSGDEIIVKDTRVFGMEIDNHFQAELNRTRAEFALPLDQDFFEEKK